MSNLNKLVFSSDYNIWLKEKVKRVFCLNISNYTTHTPPRNYTIPLKYEQQEPSCYKEIDWSQEASVPLF